jgi:hypothetical protein
MKPGHVKAVVVVAATAVEGADVREGAAEIGAGVVAEDATNNNNQGMLATSCGLIPRRGGISNVKEALYFWD